MGIALLLLVCAVFNAVFVYLDYSAAGSFSGMAIFYAAYGGYMLRAAMHRATDAAGPSRKAGL